MLREIKSDEKCYDPLVVSIGPYHYGSPGLQLVEKHKIPMTRQYVMDSERYSRCIQQGSWGGWQCKKMLNWGINTRVWWWGICSNDVSGWLLCFAIHVQHYEKQPWRYGDEESHYSIYESGHIVTRELTPFSSPQGIDELEVQRRWREGYHNTFIKHTRALPPLSTTCQEKLSRFIPINIWGWEVP